MRRYSLVRRTWILVLASALFGLTASHDIALSTAETNVRMEGGSSGGIHAPPSIMGRALSVLQSWFEMNTTTREELDKNVNVIAGATLNDISSFQEPQEGLWFLVKRSHPRMKEVPIEVPLKTTQESPEAPIRCSIKLDNVLSFTLTDENGLVRASDVASTRMLARPEIQPLENALSTVISNSVVTLNKDLRLLTFTSVAGKIEFIQKGAVVSTPVRYVRNDNSEVAALLEQPQPRVFRIPYGRNNFTLTVQGTIKTTDFLVTMDDKGSAFDIQESPKLVLAVVDNPATETVLDILRNLSSVELRSQGSSVEATLTSNVIHLRLTLRSENAEFFPIPWEITPTSYSVNNVTEDILHGISPSQVHLSTKEEANGNYFVSMRVINSMGLTLIPTSTGQNSFKASPAISTLIAGPPPLMDLEQELANLFAEVQTMTITDDLIRFTFTGNRELQCKKQTIFSYSRQSTLPTRTSTTTLAPGWQDIATTDWTLNTAETTAINFQDYPNPITVEISYHSTGAIWILSHIFNSFFITLTPTGDDPNAVTPSPVTRTLDESPSNVAFLEGQWAYVLARVDSFFISESKLILGVGTTQIVMDRQRSHRRLQESSTTEAVSVPPSFAQPEAEFAFYTVSQGDAKRLTGMADSNAMTAGFLADASNMWLSFQEKNSVFAVFEKELGAKYKDGAVHLIALMVTNSNSAGKMEPLTTIQTHMLDDLVAVQTIRANSSSVVLGFKDGSTIIMSRRESNTDSSAPSRQLSFFEGLEVPSDLKQRDFTSATAASISNQNYLSTTGVSSPEIADVPPITVRRPLALQSTITDTAAAPSVLTGSTMSRPSNGGSTTSTLYAQTGASLPLFPTQPNTTTFSATTGASALAQPLPSVSSLSADTLSPALATTTPTETTSATLHIVQSVPWCIDRPHSLEVLDTSYRLMGTQQNLFDTIRFPVTMNLIQMGPSTFDIEILAGGRIRFRLTLNIDGTAIIYQLKRELPTAQYKKAVQSRIYAIVEQLSTFKAENAVVTMTGRDESSITFTQTFHFNVKVDYNTDMFKGSFPVLPLSTRGFYQPLIIPMKLQRTDVVLPQKELYVLSWMYFNHFAMFLEHDLPTSAATIHSINQTTFGQNVNTPTAELTGFTVDMISNSIEMYAEVRFKLAIEAALINYFKKVTSATFTSDRCTLALHTPAAQTLRLHSTTTYPTDLWVARLYINPLLLQEPFDVALSQIVRNTQRHDGSLRLGGYIKLYNTYSYDVVPTASRMSIENIRAITDEKITHAQKYLEKAFLTKLKRATLIALSQDMRSLQFKWTIQTISFYQEEMALTGLDVQLNSVITGSSWTFELARKSGSILALDVPLMMDIAGGAFSMEELGSSSIGSSLLADNVVLHGINTYRTSFTYAKDESSATFFESGVNTRRPTLNAEMITVSPIIELRHVDHSMDWQVEAEAQVIAILQQATTLLEWNDGRTIAFVSGGDEVLFRRLSNDSF